MKFIYDTSDVVNVAKRGEKLKMCEIKSSSTKQISRL